MPRSYQSGRVGGASMSGHSYEPQVTPWDRYDDDFSVACGRNADRDRHATGQYGPEESYRPSGRSSQRRNDEPRNDPYYRRDLVASYGSDRPSDDRPRPWQHDYHGRMRDYEQNDERNRDYGVYDTRRRDWDRDWSDHYSNVAPTEPRRR